MKYVAIFHGNLNYAYLDEKRYEFVIRESYELILDTMREEFPDQKYVFEASGFTLDQIARLTPDVLAKLKAAIASGQCEFMGSPYAHIMMSNFPEEDCYWSLEFSQEAYERILGSRIRSGWNPECGWNRWVPHTFKRAGFKQITLDFDAFGVSARPDIRKVEYNPDKSMFYGLDLPWFDLPGDEKAIHFPFKNVVPGLKGFARTDRVCQAGVRYFVNMVSYEDYMALIKKYSGTGEGALIMFADDAEYIGTTAWYFLKYHNQPERVFEQNPDSREKLIRLIGSCLDLGGQFVTFDHACNKLPALEEKYQCEDLLAWHRTWATAWSVTPASKQYDPICDRIREKIMLAEKQGKTDAERALVRKAWYHLTCAENSDGRWPPPPLEVHPVNRAFVEGHIAQAQKALEWVK
jgi:hypothetical protein